jgi:phosphopantetheine adenylyltransferase/dephospho-CoA kinase
VIDADRLGHRVYEPGTPGFQSVVNEFGHDIVGSDGQINRQVLGGKVFGDLEQMDRLTGIVWPEIRRLASEEIEEHRASGVEVVVLEAAVLIEAEWTDLVDEVWVVYAKQGVARQRLMTRNSLNEEQARARMDSQISNKERFEHATVRIENSDTLEQFEKRFDAQWKKLQKRVAAPAGKR